MRLSPAHRPMGLQWVQARLQARLWAEHQVRCRTLVLPKYDASLCGSWLEAHALISVGRLRRSGGGGGERMIILKSLASRNAESMHNGQAVVADPHWRGKSTKERLRGSARCAAVSNSRLRHLHFARVRQIGFSAACPVAPHYFPWWCQRAWLGGRRLSRHHIPTPNEEPAVAASWARSLLACF